MYDQLDLKVISTFGVFFHSKNLQDCVVIIQNLKILLSWKKEALQLCQTLLSLVKKCKENLRINPIVLESSISKLTFQNF